MMEKLVYSTPCRLRMRDIIEQRYRPREFNGTWVSGSELLFIDSQGGLTVENFAAEDNSTERRRRKIMSNSTFVSSNILKEAHDKTVVLQESIRDFKLIFVAVFTIRGTISL
jgi:hypothetical protein